MIGLGAYEQGQGFNVARVREHIEYPGGLEAETVLYAQDLGIAGQGRRMAGYIHKTQDPAQIQGLDGPQRPYARRVEDDALESAAQDGAGRVGGAQIAGKKRRVLDAVAPGVFPCPFDEPPIALDPDHLAGPAGERQAEIPRPAIEIEDPIVPVRCQEIHDVCDQRTVDRGIDLYEIVRLELDLDLARQPVARRWVLRSSREGRMAVRPYPRWRRGGRRDRHGE